jgi:hypothetical protein
MSNKSSSPPRQSNLPVVRTAKQLAGELGLNVHTVRIVLRARYRGPGNDHLLSDKWTWHSEKEVAEVRRYLRRVLGRDGS